MQPEDALITLESDKASMDVRGTVAEILVKVGDKVSKSDLIMHFAEEAGAQATATSTQADASAATTEPVQKTSTSISHSDTVKSSAQTLHGASHLNLDQEEEVGDQHAGPGVRRLAREFGIHLASIRGTGQKDGL
ncbi:biotin/lipoyl-containing protein [Rickettsiella massiliensis]|uniref:biotin/lipoyl-containing protein n=1 Tax=Rickettsiella massiliensis TaxID=676517 RepID=UPI00029ACF20|nr:biotin/lipoyl-containing protein [Rickettsiella massiliensis]